MIYDISFVEKVQIELKLKTVFDYLVNRLIQPLQQFANSSMMYHHLISPHITATCPFQLISTQKDAQFLRCFFRAQTQRLLLGLKVPDTLWLQAMTPIMIVLFHGINQALSQF